MTLNPKKKPLRVGLDFDNTIVCYDHVFHKVAADLSLVPAAPALSKDGVRNLLRHAGKEPQWTEIQGLVYGSRILEAKPFPGALEFIKNAAADGIELFIISHKTRTPYAGPAYDLHEAARGWLAAYSVFDDGQYGMPRRNVFFELTLQSKLQRIALQQCDVFLDDLPELLSESNFPGGTRPILFDPTGQHGATHPFTAITSWTQLLEKLHDIRS